MAIVTFEDHDEATACEGQIAELKQRLRLPPTFEFLYSHNSERVRGLFLETVSPFQFRTHVFGLNKGRATEPEFAAKDSLYRWTARSAIEAAAPHLERATLVIDGASDRGFKRELQTYLRRRMNEGNTQRVAKVKIQSSHRNSLLQLADYVAGLEAGFLNGRPKAEELWRRYLASHSVTREIWPGPE